MNTILSINRFPSYMLRKIMYTRSQYIYTLLTVASVYILALFLYILSGFSAPLIKTGMLITIALSPCLYESKIRKYNGVMEYTLPVSTFERFLYLLIRYTILIPLITLGAYMLLNTIVSFLPIENITDFTDKMSFSAVSFNKLYILLGLQSIYMLGELSFNQNSILKTTLILIGIFIGTSTLFTFILKSKFMNMDFNSPGELPMMIMGLDTEDISWRFTLLKLIHYFIPVGMWTISFFRVREKEI